ncbi:RES family NAD+ phosphorylase [Bradyrhizobium sp. Arg237L]|uniref:RES family NAD+ phosphorylase n=1 Tax=Bradyrhizobium sp. Arg237L TaxID=3003352 RepID=UPI00249EFA5E|nr:RES family NAD+ phosphorylase [Bradyrhizobium sp. Arg237L]MDI4233096.1 RES family NAD+ phosphorylase [Bradyrhizobium sp. Arg237L]
MPAPPGDLAKLVKTVTWPKGQVIHRIHLKIYGSSEFNPGLTGNARFSPIKASDGANIPTLYGGTTFDCAAMETVFHDVPFSAGLKTFDKWKLTDQAYSQLTSKRDLNLADLSGTALRKLDIQRNEFIDTEKDKYPDTRKWAEAIHAACPGAEGLFWVSRQDDRAFAIVLFGDRLAAADLLPSRDPCSVLADVTVYTDLLALAERIGVDIVGGR